MLPIQCKGCFNPRFRPFIPREIISAEELAKKILAVKGIEGVTYTGGEPMMQSKALYFLSNRVQVEITPKRVTDPILWITYKSVEEFGKQI